MVLLSSIVSAVGFSSNYFKAPSYEFEPNKEFNFNFKAVYQTRNSIISAHGELAKYVELSRDYISLDDSDKSYSVRVVLPSSSEGLTPGTNQIKICIDDDLTEIKKQGLFTLTTSACFPIKIYIPFPGEYLEIDNYVIPNVNTGENSVLSFDLWNRGKNNLHTVSYNFKIFNPLNNEILVTKSQSNIPVATQTRKKINLDLNTNTITSGYYNTSLIVNYDGDKSTEYFGTFNIGKLNVNVINYSNKFFNDSIQKFNIQIQSDWNDKIPNVYAEVNILNETSKTSPSTLSNFQVKEIATHFDFTKIPVGNQSGIITLFYDDDSKEVPIIVEIVKRPVIKKKFSIDSETLIIILAVFVIFLLIATIVVMFVIMMKRTKNTGNENGRNKT